MDLHQRFPALSDLKSRAKKRIPHFVWEYLDSATGSEATLHRNRAAFDAVTFAPSILHGEITPTLTTNLLDQGYPLPFGIAPVGMSGLIWPDAERHLARAAARLQIPYTLSTVASQPPEPIGPLTDGQGWFQLYPPRDRDILKDMLARAKSAGFHTLVLTLDVPIASRRERQTRGGLTQPPRLTPRLLAQVALCPAWALGTLQVGMPRMRLMESYSDIKTNLPSTQHIGYMLRTSPDWDYLSVVRDLWDGPLIAKGVLRPEDTEPLEKNGVDAIWVSNHAGRQFDGAPASLTVLPAIRPSTDLPLILDSGVESGLDVLRAIALGADFVMLGRGWHYALGALGPKGPDHLADILRKDLEANMGQLGIKTLAEARSLVPL